MLSSRGLRLLGFPRNSTGGSRVFLRRIGGVNHRRQEWNTPAAAEPPKGVHTFELRHRSREARTLKCSDRQALLTWTGAIAKVLAEYEAENERMDGRDPLRATNRRTSIALAEAVYRLSDDD
jgi:hypothetical protein